MRTLVLALGLTSVVSATTTLTTVTAQAADSYRRYTNAKFGTTILYPSSLLSPRAESADGSGRRFVSPDGKVLLRVFATPATRGLEAQKNKVAADWRADGSRVTYTRQSGDWFVISGFVGGDIFYEKTVLQNGVFHTMIWEYPQNLRSRLDASVTRAYNSFDGNQFAPPLR